MNRIFWAFLTVVCLLSVVMAGPRDEEGGVRQCQILDYLSEPVYQAGMAYVPQSRFDGAFREYGKSALLEFDADWEFAYYRDILWGDMDFNLRFQGTIFMGSAHVDLPETVAALVLDTGWTMRFEDGVALQIRVKPGIYGDMEAFDSDTYFMPVSAALIRRFSPDLSGIAGLEVRSGFGRPIMPIIGLEWEISDWLRLEARLPRSRLVYFISHNWYTHLGLEWENTSYALQNDHEMITLEDFRAMWGLSHWLSDQTQVTFEIGRVFDRRVEYEEAVDLPEDNFDVEKATYVRVALGGPF